MDAAEWSEWIDFESHYDMPDGYFVAGQLGSIIAGIVGGKPSIIKLVPYLEPSAPRPNIPHGKAPGLKAAFEFLKANVSQVRKPD